jgi:hypothetical protein
MRIPGHDLERVVVHEIQRLLSDVDRVATLLEPLKLSSLAVNRLTAAASQVRSMWGDLAAADQIVLLKRMVRRISIGEQQIAIQLARGGVITALIARDPNADPLPPAILRKIEKQSIALDIDAKLKRRGHELRILISSESPSDRPARPNPALIKAVARAHVWRERLFAETAADLNQLAANAGVTPRYVREISSLLYLSPRLVEMILAGKQQPGLTLDELVADLPIDWLEQEKRFGLSQAA